MQLHIRRVSLIVDSWFDISPTINDITASTYVSTCYICNMSRRVCLIGMYVHMSLRVRSAQGQVWTYQANPNHTCYILMLCNTMHMHLHLYMHIIMHILYVCMYVRTYIRENKLQQMKSVWFCQHICTEIITHMYAHVLSIYYTYVM